MQEMRDGAIDGLSAADLEAAGEQLRRLSSYVFRAIEGLRSSVSKVAPVPDGPHGSQFSETSVHCNSVACELLMDPIYPGTVQLVLFGPH